MVGGLGVAIGLLMFHSFRTYPVLDWGILSALSLAAGLAAWLIVARKLRSMDRMIAGLSSNSWMGAMAVFLPLTALTIAWMANGALDGSPPAVHMVDFIRAFDISKTEQDCIRVRSWRSEGAVETVCDFPCTWPWRTAKAAGKKVKVVTRSGWLGFEWIESCEMD